MPQHQQLQLLRHITADKQHRHSEDLPDDHAQEREDHHALLPGGPEFASEKTQATGPTEYSSATPSQVWPFDVETAAGNGILQTCLLWPPTKVPHPRQRHQLPDVPTLLLGGERDLSTPIEWLRQEANVAPGAEVVIVPDATHSVQTRATDNSGREAVYDFLTP